MLAHSAFSITAVTDQARVDHSLVTFIRKLRVLGSSVSQLSGRVTIA